MLWRNERVLYKRPCAATKKDTFSMFRPDAPLVVYDKDYWWTDAWDPISYGREYDFSQPFFAQMKELIMVVTLMVILPY